MSVWFILLGVGAFLALLETVRREQMGAQSPQTQQTTQAELFLSEDEPYQQYARRLPSVPTSQPEPSNTSTQNDVTAAATPAAAVTAPTPINGPYENATFSSNVQPTSTSPQQSPQPSTSAPAPTVYSTGGKGPNSITLG